MWTLAFGGRTAHLPDAKGLRYLQRLLEAPYQEIGVTGLVAPANGASPALPSAHREVHPESTMPLRCQPLTDDIWPDFQRLFGKRDGHGGCWCMWWHRKRREFERHRGADNRRAMRSVGRSAP